MSTPRVVLLTFREKKKLLKLSEHRNETDLQFLSKEFRKLFSIHSTGCLTFQRYSAEWESFIDLEDSDILLNKDKLTAVLEEESASLEANDTDTEVSYIVHEHVAIASYLSCVYALPIAIII